MMGIGHRVVNFFILSDRMNLRYILQEGLIRAKTVSCRRIRATKAAASSEAARRLILARTASSQAPAKFSLI